VFERFTEEARLVVVQAQREARDLNHGYIGTEHLLLGLLGNPDGVGAQVLSSFKIAADAVRIKLVEVVGRGEDLRGSQIPFTPRAKKVLELALREAYDLGHARIGTGHLLLGLTRESEGVASRVLLSFGASPAQIRERVLARLGGPDPPVSTAGPTRAMQAGSMQNVRFLVTPDRQMRRLLMAAGGRALEGERQEFGLIDLLEAALSDPEARQLLEEQIREQTEAGA